MSRNSAIDGNDLPIILRGQAGGVAAFLHYQKDAGATNSTNVATFSTLMSTELRQGMWDPALHHGTSMPASLLYKGKQVFGGNAFAVTSLDAESEYKYDKEAYGTYPSLQSGCNTNDPEKMIRPRFHPPNPPDPKPPAREPTTVDIDASPISERSKIDIPPPTDPVNHQEGWKASRPSGKQAELRDMEMEDVKAQVPPSVKGGYHFTSEIQKNFDRNKVLQKLVDTEMTISLGDLITGSPGLQKLIQEWMKMKHEYYTQSGQVHYSYTGENKPVPYVS
ncbi:hypothetical protein GYMLUDRAFT_64365 [Collybiopsis luxurians FD-317 M1]|uniref:DUF4100 domain-containing protein n=1 Tax=Collybiopsis luxurians FD-317 M1 TaxID=944289 RepID=A0A0D0BRJ9_9AGAR|nr:hypothetical protein GYMLUDRAFT_64365 [Collybiopsis luxurians FD-317 M1]